ncbi:MAG: DEAD/DEAH box helicase family protein [Clostridium paraputrificum]
MGKKYEIGTKFNDILTEDEIEKWNNENIILNGATGSGKTYFVENNLHRYAKKHFKSILFLCNRTALFRDVKEEKEIFELKRLNIMLYQTLQNKLKNKEEIEKYDYIVCDEFHYVLTDALFNKYTDLTYDWIINQTNSTKIFMSGTGKIIFNKLKADNIVKEEFEYIIPYDYSYANVKLYGNQNNVYDIINDILENTDDKIIYFANSLDFALEVYTQFEKFCDFRCSNNIDNEKAKEINNIECIKTYGEDLITFKNRVLITTKALDNGITIKDRQVKHIICDIFDLESHQQCLGRKRVIDKNDKCTFYIRNYDKQSIGRFKGGLKKNYNPVELFIKDREEFQNKYDVDRSFHSSFIYFENGERRYNKLAYWKMLCELVDVDLEEKIGYANLLLDRLGDTILKIEDLDKIKEYEKKSELELYLRGIIDKYLYKEEKEELINKIGLKDSRGRLQKGLSTISEYLQDNFKLFIITDSDNRRKLDNGEININRRKTYWMIKEGKIA